MKKTLYILVTYTGLCLLQSFALAQDAVPPVVTESADKTPTVEEILSRAEQAIAKVKDYKGKMIKYERFGKKVEKAVMKFKFQRPFKVYVKFIRPHEGREAIYKAGWNDGEVKTHKGDFPDITLNLDPLGGTAMDENHHPITHFGLENTIKISGGNLRKAIKRGEGEFKVVDGGKMFGQEVWKIEAKFPKGGYFIKAKDDETLWDISKRTGQDCYMIMYNNKDYDEPDDVDEDDKVFIPRYYGGKAEFVVSKKTNLPVKASTWDWAGRLYESYEYPKLILNPGLTSQDFNPDNKAYDF